MDLRYNLNKFPFLNKIIYYFRLSRLKLLGVKINRSVIIEGRVNAKLGPPNLNQGNISIASRVYLGDAIILHAYRGSIEIDTDSYIGPGCKLYGHGGLFIGKKVLLGPDVKILSSNHTIPSKESFIKDLPDLLAKTIIEDDVWLGANVTVLAGVTIGRGSVVGAGAVVTKSTPNYSISAGVPAKVLKYRD